MSDTKYGCHNACSYCRNQSQTDVPCRICRQTINPEHKIYWGRAPAPSWVKGNLDQEVIWSHVDCYARHLQSKSTYFQRPDEYSGVKPDIDVD